MFGDVYAYVVQVKVFWLGPHCYRIHKKDYIDQQPVCENYLIPLKVARIVFTASS